MQTIFFFKYLMQKIKDFKKMSKTKYFTNINIF